MRFRWLAGLALALSALAFPALAAPPQATIDTGQLAGASNGNIRVFKNIPFAAPPVGNLRWRPPQRPASWSGVRDATAYGAACPQPDRPDGAGGGRADRQSEDCLTLNVWAPANARNMPVMVWIHGGANRLGSGAFPVYDGSALARQGVIVVTINYRLGLLGFFDHPALAAEDGQGEAFGNYGLMDQIAALEWVKRNIAAFGGDPANVTAFGESAGGSNLIYLITSPAARGLFSKVIIESGGGTQNPQGVEETRAAGLAAAGRIGLGPNATAADLRAVPAERWNEAAGAFNALGFGPFIDGRIVVEAPWQAFESGRAMDIPMIIGANSNEASVLATFGAGPGAVFAFAGLKMPQLRAAYGAPPLSDNEFYRQVLGDATFVAPARWVAQQTASGAPTFLYYFSYVAEVRQGDLPGAGHGSEIPYIFQSWNRIPVLAPYVRPDDQAMARKISACWVAFAKTGIPSCSGVPAWPAYGGANGDVLMEWGARVRVQRDFRKAQLDFDIARTEELRSMGARLGRFRQ